MDFQLDGRLLLLGAIRYRAPKEAAPAPWRCSRRYMFRCKYQRYGEELELCSLSSETVTLINVRAFF